MQLNLKTIIIASVATSATAIICSNTQVVPATLINQCQCKANFNQEYFAWGYTVNDYKAGCDSVENQYCNQNTACDLWNTIIDKTAMNQRIAAGNAAIINAKPTWYGEHSILSMASHHWLVLPGSYNARTAVTGVEDVAHRSEGSWNAAWQTRPALASRIGTSMGWSHLDSIQATLGCAVNPPHMRSRHQLHFHVARVKLSLRKALSNKQKYTGAPADTGVDKLYALYFPNNNGIVSGFASAANNFKQAATAAGQAAKYLDAGHHGIMVVPGEDGQGYYLVMGYDVHVENYLCGGSISTSDPECAYYWHMS